MVDIFYPISFYYKISFLFWFGRQDIPLPNFACVLDYYALWRAGIFSRQMPMLSLPFWLFLSASLILKIPGNTSVINFCLYDFLIMSLLIFLNLKDM